MSDENYRLMKNDAVNQNSIFTHPQIDSVVHAIEVAGDHGIEPTIISEGSSGSYFVRNIDKKILGVFKPKDEEPYAASNPKWGKYFHKMCCPCCFGRVCLINNHGYLSEVGASLVDEALQLNLVPTTRVTSITSQSFNHNKINIMKSKTKTQIAEKFPDLGRKFQRLGVPPKTGSLQLFVTDYISADKCAEALLTDTSLDKALSEELLFQFQKLTVLDYIIRNTDRNNSNWLIKVPRKQTATESGDIADGDEKQADEDSPGYIAAIDNGLAFPFKHPDELRAYPYHWAWLTTASVPFSERLCDHLLPRLMSSDFVEGLVRDLRVLFKLHEHFKKSIFERQMSVMRGQITNLCAALQQSKSPQQLVEMAPMTVEPIRLRIGAANSNHFLRHGSSSDIDTSDDHRTQLPTPPHGSVILSYVTRYWRRPFFKNF